MHMNYKGPEVSHRQSLSYWRFFFLQNAAFLQTVMVFFQLFRRVAAALPGMESVQEPSKEGSIL